jgi:two-component system cell cycle sensor histidine kinase/response regulator CckA
MSGKLGVLVNEFNLPEAAHILDEMPLGLWVASAPSGEVLYTNQWFRKIMGMEAVGGAEIEAAPVAYGIYDRQGKLYRVENLPFSLALARGEPVVVDDIVIHRRDGARVCVRAFANPVRDEQGVINHVVIAFTEITAEVRAVVERAEIEKHLEVAIHHAPVLLFMMDRNAVLTASEGALRATVDPEGALVGLSILEIYKDHPTVPGYVLRALAGETLSYSVEVQGLILDVWIGPVRDAAGEIAGAIGVCTDITESRRLQTRIIQEDRIRAMGTLAASVAHEINNPLTYVLAGLERALRELDELSTTLRALTDPSTHAIATDARNRIDSLREWLGPALTGTERIQQVTRQLSTFTRPNDQDLRPIDLGSVVRSVLKLVRKEIEARARLVEELGASRAVLGNEAQLVQVLVNLLMNAWQALPEPDPARHVIGIRTANLDSDVLIEVWDSGPGVPPQLREQIFEPFITTKEIGSGTGLGLFVCRNIVNSLHGRISVHDAPGGGALFQVVLPATTPLTATPSARQGEDASVTEGRLARILIIDDDPLVAAALAAAFAGRPFEIRAVHDGRQGLQIIVADAGLDLVYCDLMMKDFSGIDLYEELRRRAPERLPKLVFMTGGAFTDQAQAFLDQRGDTIVHKPFDILADARRRLA